MTKRILRITTLCAACSLFAATAWAQSQDQPPSDSMGNNRSWSTKRLSATGRDNEQAVRASKLAGAQVNDPSGQNVGTIQDVIISPSTGRIDFALLSLNSASMPSTSTYNSNSTTSEHTMNHNSNGKLVPVPWSLLRTSASSQYSVNSGQPMFTLNVDQKKLSSAPTVGESDLSQSQWQQRIYSYYGVTPQPMGGSDSPQGEIKGEGARHMQETTPPQQQHPTP